MDQATLEGLFKKGAINQSTLDMGMSKIAPKPEVSEAPPAVAESPTLASAPAESVASGPTPAVFNPGAPSTGQPQGPIKLASDTRPEVAVDKGPGEMGLSQSFELAQKAQAQGAQAEGAQADAEASVIGKAQRAVQRQQDASLVAEAERQKQMGDQIKSIESSAAEAAKMGKVDPNRFWKDKNTGEKVGFGIAAFLGAFNPSGQNAALEMIKSNIDRDVEAQKQDYERAKGNVGLQQGIYSDMMKKFGDARMAESASRLAILGNAELQLKQTAASYKSPQVQAKALEGIAHIEQQKQVLIAGAKQAAEVHAAKQRLAGGSAGAQLQVDVEKLPESERQRFVPGVGFALDDESAKKARELSGNTKSVNGMIDDLIKMREEKGTAFLPSEQKAKMQTTAAKLQLAVKEATRLGTLDKGAEKFMEKLVGDPTRIGQVVSQLEALKDSVNQEHAVRMKEYVPGSKQVNFSPAN